MFGRETILNKIPAAGGCTNIVDNYNPFPDGGGLALYQLNGNIQDSSGNYDLVDTNNDVTLNFTTGVFGQSLSPTSSSESSRLENTSLPDYASMSVWIKLNSFSVDDDRIFSYSIRDQNTTNPEIVTSNGGVSLSTSDNLTIGVWTHVVVVIDGTNLNVYYNGSFQTSRTVASGTLLSYKRLFFASDAMSTARFELDQARLFSRALRPYEVEALYTEEYCTPTIVPSEHFNTVTYSGQATDKQVTGVGFQPDLTWVKCRNVVNSHVLSDSVRGGNGTTLYFLSSNLTNADSSSNQIKSLDLDGFTVWGDRSAVNRLNQDYVAWNFKAGGAAVTNTDGTITSQVSANTEAGFSVVSWASTSTTSTIGHGLESTPSIIFMKSRTNTGDWQVYSSEIGATQKLLLNGTNAASSSGVWGNTNPNENVFTSAFNSVGNVIAYCFAEVEGFSNFGSYVGTGASGNTVVTGFEPAFLLVRRTDSGDNWLVFDNKRSPSSPVNLALFPNSSAVEEIGNLGDGFTFLENGFNVVSTDSGVNANGGKYIYMAFAADPTTIEPSLEDSFNTVTYTGNGSTQTIGGVFEGGGSFNGSSSNIQIDTFSGFTNYNFTLSVWIKTTDSVGYAIGFRDPIYMTLGTGLYSGGTNGMGIYDGTNQYFINNTAMQSINDGSWKHIVMTHDGTNLKGYINGSIIDTVPTGTTTQFSGGTNFNRIGLRGDGNTSAAFNGEIDQVRIFDTALTAAQVTELYEETDADSSVCDFPSGAGGIALYELNGNANDTCGTYNGTASNVTWLNNGVGFQPDLVWIKSRVAANSHKLYDSTRGTFKALYSNVTAAEANDSPNGVISFDSNGFSVKDDSNGNYGVNGGIGGTYSGNPPYYVAWCWKGAELPAINSNGSIPSVVSANPAAGFSIVTFTGNGQTGATVGHGLGTAPAVVINKGRANLATYNNWYVWHKDLPNPNTDLLILNNTDASASDGNYFGGSPTDSTLIFGNDIYGPNVNGTTYVNYVFAEVAGFSKFGSYTGTGGVLPEQTLGFEPAFIMFKRTDSTGDWFIYDNKRDTTDPRTVGLYANLSAAEYNTSGSPGYADINFLPNGFSMNANYVGINASGGTFIYMAFADQF